MKNFQLNPFDLILAIVLLIGLVRGRKRGISEELLEVFEWVAIVVAAAFAYRPIGDLLVTYANLPTLYANLLGYILAAAVIVILFKSLKRAVGEKLIQGDTFGRFEFHLGALGGGVRAFCMVIFVLALLYAHYSTPAERAAAAREQQETYGSGFFPTIDGLQQSVFFESYSGKFIRTNLARLLIQPVPPGPARADNSLKARRERAVNDALGIGK